MRVAIVAGILVPRDAISGAVVEQVESLLSLASVSAVSVFAQFIDRKIPCFSKQIGSSWDLIRQPQIESADIVIFHWGIFYELALAAFLVAADPAKRVAIHFHNCSPVELVPEVDRPVVERSLEQINHLIASPVRFWTYSEFNRRTLLAWGAEPETIDNVTFPVPMSPRNLYVSTAKTVQMICVGRFVPSKGLTVLVEAVALLPSPLQRQLRLVLVGNTLLSEKGYLEALKALITHQRLDDVISFVENPTDELLSDLYNQADVLVSPSLHEGLCVPVIEAFAHGCRAIGSNAGNLPFLMTEDDVVVEVNDPASLAQALVGELSRGKKTTNEPFGPRRRVVDRYSRGHSTIELQTAIGRLFSETEFRA